jgi:hypothetical protein
MMITFVSGDISRSRDCTCSPLDFGIQTSTKAKEIALLRTCAKKNFHVFETLRLQPIGIQEFHHRIPHRGVIIENADGIRACWHGIKHLFGSRCYSESTILPA